MFRCLEGPYHKGEVLFMKKRKLTGAIILASAAVLALTACSSLQKSDSQESGRTQNTAGGTVIQQAADSVGTDGSADAPDASQVPGAGDASVSAGAAEEEPVGEIIPDEDAEAAEQENAGDTSDAWTGAYVGDEESVSIALLDDATISFSFAQSGISGTASVNGMQAVYNGDDHYVVVFNLNGDVLDVSVSNEEDYDASESPLNGTYVKE